MERDRMALSRQKGGALPLTFASRKMLRARIFCATAQIQQRAGDDLSVRTDCQQRQMIQSLGLQ